MGLLDKLTGTRRPPDGVSPLSAVQLQTILFGLNGPDVPYLIRDGAASGADLVAEWRIAEPAWQNFFIESQLTRAVRIRMRLVGANHEVRVVEEQWEVTRVGNPPRLRTESAYSRGPDRTVTRRWTIERKASGGFETTETFRFDSAELRNPLRSAVLKCGWTWRGVVFGKL